MKEFSFTEFDEFKKFVTESKFEYKSDLQNAMVSLQKVVTNKPTNTALAKDIESLIQKHKENTNSLLEASKSIIIKQIEKEIIPRYYLQKGKIEKSLQVDQEIQDAINLLNDQVKYKSLLK